MIDSKEILSQLEKRLQTYEENPKTRNIGRVEKNTDAVITASGLSQAAMGELIDFQDGSTGFVLNLDEDSVSIILLTGGKNVKEGDIVKTTGRLLSIKASEELLGRVVDPLGNALDGKTDIKKGKDMP